MMCQCKLISCNKCTTLVGDVDNGGSYACIGAGGLWEISLPSTQFSCKPKNGLKVMSIRKSF